jgi:hypothetical protein
MLLVIKILLVLIKAHDVLGKTLFAEELLFMKRISSIFIE